MKITTPNLFPEKIRKYVSDICYLSRDNYRFKFHINSECVLLINVYGHIFRVIALPITKYSCAQPPVTYLPRYLNNLVNRIENPLTYPAEIKDKILANCDSMYKDYLESSFNLLDDIDLRFLYYEDDYTIASLISDHTIMLIKTKTGMKYKLGYIGPYVDNAEKLVINALKDQGESVGRFWPTTQFI